MRRVLCIWAMIVVVLAMATSLVMLSTGVKRPMGEGSPTEEWNFFITVASQVCSMLEARQVAEMLPNGDHGEVQVTHAMGERF